MPVGHITKTGNISIPKPWRDELGIVPDSNVLLEKKDGKIIIEPIAETDYHKALQEIDNKAKKQGVNFTVKEAVSNHGFY